MDLLKNSSAIPLARHIPDVIAYLGLDRLAEGEFQKQFLNHSIVYSNVPGMSHEIYQEGKEIAGLYCHFTNALPQIILLSYNNRVLFSFTTDQAVVEHPREIVDGFETAVEELAELCSTQRA